VAVYKNYKEEVAVYKNYEIGFFCLLIIQGEIRTVGP